MVHVRVRSLALTAFAFLSALPAQAEVRVSVILETPKSEAVRTYVKGLGDAFGWANARLRQTGRPLFCVPENLTITPEQYIEIIRQEVLRGPDFRTMYAGVVLMGGLERTFPCPKS